MREERLVCRVSIPHLGFLLLRRRRLDGSEDGQSRFNPSSGFSTSETLRWFRLFPRRAAVSIPHLGFLLLRHGKNEASNVVSRVSIPHLGFLLLRLFLSFDLRVRRRRRFNPSSGFSTSETLSMLISPALRVLLFQSLIWVFYF